MRRLQKINASGCCSLTEGSRTKHCGFFGESRYKQSWLSLVSADIGDECNGRIKLAVNDGLP
ncbi:MAG: hypothetical protein WBW25_00340 [Halobacteriota archaeon]